VDARQSCAVKVWDGLGYGPFDLLRLRSGDGLAHQLDGLLFEDTRRLARGRVALDLASIGVGRVSRNPGQLQRAGVGPQGMAALAGQGHWVLRRDAVQIGLGGEGGIGP